MPTDMPDKRKGAAPHTEGALIDHNERGNLIPAPAVDDLPGAVVCPSCEGKGQWCDDCTGGTVTPQREEIIEIQQAARRSPMIGGQG